MAELRRLRFLYKGNLDDRQSLDGLLERWGIGWTISGSMSVLSLVPIRARIWCENVR